MSPTVKPNRRPRILLTALFAILAGLAGAMLTTSETLLRSSFAAALGTATTKPVVHALAAAPILAGSEDFWLTAMKSPDGGPLSKAVAIGDRIAMTLDGRERRFEVTSVNEFTPAKTEIDTRADGVRLVLVTARDTSETGKRPIRFVMEIEAAPVAAPQVRAGRTL